MRRDLEREMADHQRRMQVRYYQQDPPTLPTDSEERKNLPVMRGVVDYFPAAVTAVSALSMEGNRKHNPGEELHWARGKSTDHADCILRHLMERGTIDTDGIRHSVKVAWRALALLQEELELQEGAPISRGSRLPEVPEAELEKSAADNAHIEGALIPESEWNDLPHSAPSEGGVL